LPHRDHDHGIAELYTITLIIVLIGTAVVIMVSVSTGFAAGLLQKPPAFSVQAKVSPLFPGTNGITLIHGKGDPVFLINESATGPSTGVFFTLVSPDGEKIAVHPSPGMGANPWAEGGTIILYYDGSRFWVTDDPASLAAKTGSGGLADLPPGTWTVYVTDQQTQVTITSITVTV